MTFFVITRRRFYLARTPWTHMNHVFRAVYLPSFDAQFAMIYCMLGIVTFQILKIHNPHVRSKFATR